MVTAVEQFDYFSVSVIHFSLSVTQVEFSRVALPLVKMLLYGPISRHSFDSDLQTRGLFYREAQCKICEFRMLCSFGEIKIDLTQNEIKWPLLHIHDVNAPVQEDMHHCTMHSYW